MTFDPDLTDAVESAARASFDRGQASRLDAGRFKDDGRPFTFDDITRIDQNTYRQFVLPIVVAAMPAIIAQADRELDSHQAKITAIRAMAETWIDDAPRAHRVHEPITDTARVQIGQAAACGHTLIRVLDGGEPS